MVRQINGGDSGDKNARKYKDFHDVSLFFNFLPFVMERTV